MSTRATTWALFDCPGLNPSQRVVLLVLADYAHNDGTKAFPSQSTIAEATELSQSSVKRIIKELLSLGVISKGDQRHAEFLPANARPTVYNLAMDDRRRAQNTIAQTAKGSRVPSGKKMGGAPMTPRKSDTNTVDKAVNNMPETVDKAVDENVDKDSGGFISDGLGGSLGGSPMTPNPLTQKITHHARAREADELSTAAPVEDVLTECMACNVAKPETEMTVSGVCRDCCYRGPSTEGSPGRAAFLKAKAEMKAKNEARRKAELEAITRRADEAVTASRSGDTLLTERQGP